MEIDAPLPPGRMTLLRPFTADDITDDYLGWLRDPEVMRYSNQRFRTHDRSSCLGYLRSFGGTDNLFLSIRDLSDGKAIGTMTAYLAAQHGTADVGIMVGDRRVWGRGFGQDAWTTMVEWLLARSDIRKVTAGTLACNTGMIRLAERSGMQIEGIRRAQELVGGVPTDILLFARFADA